MMEEEGLEDIDDPDEVNRKITVLAIRPLNLHDSVSCSKSHQ